MKPLELIAGAGRGARAAALHAGRVALLFWTTVKSLARPRNYASETFAQAKRIGVDGMPLVLLMGALSGAVMAQQGDNLGNCENSKADDDQFQTVDKIGKIV